MKRLHLLIAAAGALGLSASLALAQQEQPSVTEQEEPMETAATETAESPAEPRSDEDVLADHRAAFFARIEERKRTSEDIEAQVELRSALRYHPAW